MRTTFHCPTFRSRAARLLLAFATLLLTSTSSSAQAVPSGTPDFAEQSGRYEVRFYHHPFRVELENRETGRLLIRTRGALTIRHLRFVNVTYSKPYTFFGPGVEVYKEQVTRVTSHTREGDFHVFYLGNEGSDQIAACRFRWNPDQSFHLEFREVVPPAEGIRETSELSVELDSDEADNYLGMGMRFQAVNHAGSIVTHWASEVGPNLPEVTEHGTVQGRDITYAPVPFYLNLKGYGLFLDSHHYSVFDFAKTQPGIMRITCTSDRLNLRVYPGDNPLDIVGSYFQSHGAYTLPKPWVFGVWAAAGTDYQSKEKGQQVNETVLQKCRAHDIPLSAIMAEDWYFDFLSIRPIDTWTVNRKYYPDYEAMIEKQHQAGVRHIAYYLPYFAKRKVFRLDNTFKQARDLGVLTRNKRGKPFVFKFFVWKNAQMDWTHPGAADFFHSRFFSSSEQKGVDGWMNDFGEYTPYLSLSANGEWGSSMHNRYPLLWAKTAHEFFTKARPDGDFCLFSRSGAAGLHQYNAFIFTGDRNATYDPLSGLGGQITGVLSGSLSVHPNVSSDIGAYNCVQAKPMNKLQMFRWIELGALLPVMRLHRGVQLCDHWRFDEDEETLMQWKKYATLHARLFPYIYTLAAQATERGWPMVRHLSLYDPGDSRCLQQDTEFLLGDRILSCPVTDDNPDAGRSDITKARQTWSVYLPEGNWYHYWSRKKYTGRSTCEVPAAPGFLPMFIREGRIIPMFEEGVDTLVEDVEDPTIRDFEAANSTMEIFFYGYGADTLTLWDGTEITCAREAGEQGTHSVSGGTERQYRFVFVDAE